MPDWLQILSAVVGLLFGGGGLAAGAAALIRAGRYIETIDQLKRALTRQSEVIEGMAKELNEYRSAEQNNHLTQQGEFQKHLTSSEQRLSAKISSDIRGAHERIDSLQRSVVSVATSVDNIKEGNHERLTQMDRVIQSSTNVASDMAALKGRVDRCEKDIENNTRSIGGINREIGEIQGRDVGRTNSGEFRVAPPQPSPRPLPPSSEG